MNYNGSMHTPMDFLFLTLRWFGINGLVGGIGDDAKCRSLWVHFISLV